MCLINSLTDEFFHLKGLFLKTKMKVFQFLGSKNGRVGFFVREFTANVSGSVDPEI